ncbi:hypothetical protein [Sphingobium vermicomposti]
MLGKRPISEIQPMEVPLALRPIEKKGRHVLRPAFGQ